MSDHPSPLGTRASRVRRFLVCLSATLLAFGSSGCAVRNSGIGPVTLAFDAPLAAGNPLARELWAEVALPSGNAVRLPAYHDSGTRFAVRTTASEAGTYRLLRVVETAGSNELAINATPVDASGVRVEKADALPFIRIDPARPSRFIDDAGSPYVPIGTNLPWSPHDEVIAHYETRFQQLADARLNWTRIWMCHWGRLNLDWAPTDAGPSPTPGTIDPAVAERWDRILELAETHGIRLQMVFQHHGQYSTEVNPNWDEHPWNAAHPGGFLKTPGEFFTSPEARAITRQKYRYIVARWGYSPAILAWELFNEVHWVDAMRIEHNETAVAAWHAEMADWIRSLDAHRHLITTSTDNLKSPVYERMDFLQPHLYARDMLAATRHLDEQPAGRQRPVFYGEFGDDNQLLTDEQRRLSRATVPPVWSGLMGDAALPAQIWYGERLIEGGAFHELEAVARFVQATQIGVREGLRSFAPAVSGGERVPLRISGAMSWHRGQGGAIEVPLDGSEPEGLGELASHLVSPEARAESNFPDHCLFRIRNPDTLSARIRLGAAGSRGSEARVLLDGAVVATREWPAGESPERNEPADLAFEIPAGEHEVEIRNVTGPDWFEFLHFDTGLETPVLAAVGKRNEEFVALWIWHRENISAVAPGTSATATLAIPELAAGLWSVTWWDTLHGTPQPAQTIDHPGGTLSLPTPPIARHAAVVLER